MEAMVREVADPEWAGLLGRVQGPVRHVQCWLWSWTMTGEGTLDLSREKIVGTLGQSQGAEAKQLGWGGVAGGDGASSWCALEWSPL